jgi:dihydrofolate reductase
MSKVVLDISTSLDGFVAGPNPTLEQPLGEGGERLHDWVVVLASWRERHGHTGGERNVDDEVMKEAVASQGSILMGRRMFSGGDGPWESDPNADGWWGDTPPFHAPVFVVTHHEREPVAKEGGTTYTFVTDGIEAAVDQARAAAGDADVAVVGGASIAQQVLRAGLLDEMQIHVAPILLGGGTRLLDGLEGVDVELECTRVVESPAVTHLRYRVVK